MDVGLFMREGSCKGPLFFSSRQETYLVDRSVVFLDGGYIDKLLEDHFNRQRIDYGAFVSEIAASSNIVRTYYYHCPPYQSNPPTEEERERLSRKQAFFNALSRLNRFQLRLGKLEKRGEENGRPLFVQKRVDIMLGVDMVQLAATRQIQKAILVAGDSDLLPAVEATKQLGVVVSLWHGPYGDLAVPTPSIASYGMHATIGRKSHRI